jgi:hypothetical protein
METMDAYPGKTVVLMDVDCIIHGDIAPVTRIAGDVGIVVIAQNVRRRGKKRWAHWLAVECSSRVIVFQPTEGARAFVKTWADTIERSIHQGDLARRAGRVPVLQAIGARPLHLTDAGRRRGIDLAGAARLHAGRHRLARATTDLAPPGCRLIGARAECRCHESVAPATRPRIYVRQLIEARAKQLLWRAWRSILQSFPTTLARLSRC